MIVVRDIFQVKFGRMKEAIAFWKEMQKASPQPPETLPRVLTDFTGPYYTLVLEGTFKDLADYERYLHREMTGDAGELYHKKFVPLVDSGRREIFTVAA